MIISVGRFSYMNGYGKGYDTLLRISEHLPKILASILLEMSLQKSLKNGRLKKINACSFSTF